MKNNFCTIAIASITCLVLSVSLTISGCVIVNTTDNNTVTEQSGEALSSEALATVPEEHSAILETTTEEESTCEITTVNEITTHSKTVTEPESTEKITQKSPSKPETSKVSATRTTTNQPEALAYTPERDVIKIYNAINDYREENGLNRLVLDEELCKLAYIRAQEQEQIEGHTRPNGTPADSIASEYGYKNNGFGENIIIGPDANCDETVDCWKNSPGHNKNMLKGKWTKTGMAMCILDNGEYAIVQLFAY